MNISKAFNWVPNARLLRKWEIAELCEACISPHTEVSILRDVLDSVNCTLLEQSIWFSCDELQKSFRLSTQSKTTEVIRNCRNPDQKLPKCSCGDVDPRPSPKPPPADISQYSCPLCNNMTTLSDWATWCDSCNYWYNKGCFLMSTKWYKQLGKKYV